MSFIAGIAQEDAIEQSTRMRFHETPRAFKKYLAWSLGIVDAKDHILAEAAPTDMWDGPKAKVGGSARIYMMITTTGTQKEDIQCIRS